MSVAALDTHEIVKDLLAAGFTNGQAEAVARNLRKAQDLDLSSLATKTDMANVNVEIEKVRGEVEKVRGEIAASKADILKWMFGVIGLQTIVILGSLVTLVRMLKP